jgi:hypothetical protein
MTEKDRVIQWAHSNQLFISRKYDLTLLANKPNRTPFVPHYIFSTFSRANYFVDFNGYPAVILFHVPCSEYDRGLFEKIRSAIRCRLEVIPPLFGEEYISEYVAVKLSRIFKDDTDV